MQLWGLSRELEQARERTLTICYEDLSSKDKDLTTINNVLDFLYNRTEHKPWSGNVANMHNAGGHSSSKNPVKKRRLLEVIKQLDVDVFNGEIAWLDSTLPC